MKSRTSQRDVAHLYRGYCTYMMRYSFLIPALAAATQAHSVSERFAGGLSPRQNDAEVSYIDSVCLPNITSPLPPCQEIINIESACEPSGTTALDYLAHQECMCGGSFFSDWNGCLNCQYVHGSRSEAEAEAFSSILSTVSMELCTGTPTASFAALFASVTNTAPQQASGAATVLSDQYPSQSAVSLYYTASASQGPGAITGSAAQATATAITSRTSTSGSETSSSSGGDGGAATTSSVKTGSSKSSTSSSTSQTSKSRTSSSGTTTSASTSATQTGTANRYGGSRVKCEIAALIACLSIFIL